MRFIADECCDNAVLAALRDGGHDVRSIAESSRGADDATVIGMAITEGRVLVTEDKDFGNLAVRQAVPVPGVVLIRIDPKLRWLKRQRIDTLMARFEDRLVGHYTVVDANRFRMRPLRRLP